MWGRLAAMFRRLRASGRCSSAGIIGTHIHVSSKHLPKYLGELKYRWNVRAVPHLMLDRLL